MIVVLIEAALRSLLVGVVVAAGLRVFRVHNVLAQKAAWGLVLTAALAMPWLLPTMGRLHLLPATASIILPAHPMTLLEELQARILAKNPSGRLPQPKASAVPIDKPTAGEVSNGSAPEPARTTPPEDFMPSPAAGDKTAAPSEL